MSNLPSVLKAICPLDVQAMEAARHRLLRLTKPPGSLGVLEDLAVQVAGITGQALPSIMKKAILIMAADHGVTAEGVSAYPAEVTGQMVQNFLRGGAAINVLSRQIGAEMVVVDIGVATTVLSHPNLVSRKVAHGTKNIARGPAMIEEEVQQALAVGIDVVETLVAQGVSLLGMGDMGIGNTTAASAVTAALAGLPVALVTGPGTGLDPAGVRHKERVIQQALEINAPDPTDPLDVLAKVGGLEIAGLTGAILRGASLRIPIVIDGFITAAAALIATALSAEVQPYLISGHRSAEPGHRVLLDLLKLRPLFDLEMRLGEGTGAALAMQIVEAAVRLLREMATFEEAHVSRALKEIGS